MLTAADIRSAIEFARTDEDCLAEARLLHSEIAGKVLSQKSRSHQRPASRERCRLMLA